VLVAMNPAALKVNLPDLEEGGTLIINTMSSPKIILSMPLTRRTRSRMDRWWAIACINCQFRR
jgi:hypothetical protein